MTTLERWVKPQSEHALRPQLDALLKTEDIKEVGVENVLERLGFDVRTKKADPESDPEFCHNIAHIRYLSVSCNKLSTPPPMFWRPLCNTVIVAIYHIPISADGERDGEKDGEENFNGSQSDPISPRYLVGLNLGARGVPEVFYTPSAELPRLLAHADEYDICPVIYGSVLWCYHLRQSPATSDHMTPENEIDADVHKGRWIVGTKRAADCSLTPIRGVNLAELLWSIVDPNSLDKSMTYSFLIHHRPLHVFEYDFVTRLWVIAIRDCGTTITVKVGTHEEVPPVIVWPLNKNGVRIEEFPRTRGSIEKLEEKFRSLSNSLNGTGELGVILRRRVADYERDGKIEKDDDNSRSSPATVDYIIKSALYSFIDRKMGDPSPINILLSRLLFDSVDEQRTFLTVFPSLEGGIKLCKKKHEELSKTLAVLIGEIWNKQPYPNLSRPPPIVSGHHLQQQINIPTYEGSMQEVANLAQNVVTFMTTHRQTLGRGMDIDSLWIQRVLIDPEFSDKNKVIELIGRMVGPIMIS